MARLHARTSEPLSAHLRACFAQELRTLLGLSFPDSRLSALDRGVYQAAARIPAANPTALLERLRARDPATVAVLIEELTVGETYFFREPRHFAFLRAFLHDTLHTAPGPDIVRLWSAGCASGEEAYSMAIVALDLLGERAAERLSILGTDVHEGALDRARAGEYRAWSLRGVAPELRDRWFVPHGTRWRVRDQVRHLVRFQPLNLLDITSPSRPRDVHIAFCRNVLLYLEPTAIAIAGVGIRDALVPEGWLVTASCDPMVAGAGLRTDTSNGFLAYRRITARPTDLSTSGSSAAPRRPAPIARPRALPSSPPSPRPASGDRNDGQRPDQPPNPLASAPGESADSPGNPGEILAAARHLADSGDMQAALHAIDTALVTAPTMAAGYLLRATLRQSMGDHRSVVVDAQRALLLDRSLAFAHVLAASSRAALGDTHDARQALRKARKALIPLPRDALVTGLQETTAGELLALCDLLEQAFTHIHAASAHSEKQ